MSDLSISCHICGRVFEPTPDSFMECGMRTVVLRKDDKRLEDDAVLTRDQLVGLNEYGLMERGLDEAARQAMMNARPGDSIDVGAVAVCECCQKEMLSWPEA